VIDILPDRAASSVEVWMRNHRDIKYVVRDRDGRYAEGATKGTPQAKQVADRFQLLQNLGQTIEAELIGWNPGADRRCQQANRPSWPSLAGAAVHARVWQGETCAR
jgi:transposase